MVYERYDADYGATGRFLRGDAGLAAAVGLAASDAADEARIIVLAEAYDTGALASSISVERSDGTDRVGYDVRADDPAAAPTQFGNRKMPASEVVTFLQDGARNVGLDIHGG